MNWKIKASLQKILSAVKLGDQLNHLPAAFQKNYHANVFNYQTHECLRKFNYGTFKLDKNSVALEIGTGYSAISALTLSLLGFHKIITVDITSDLRFSTFKKQISTIDSDSFIEKIVPNSFLSKKEITEKIALIKETKTLKELFEKLNIIYLAPYQFEDIEKYAHSFDYICSQVVLEHVPVPILDTLFKKTKEWLKPDGLCVHTINFIDHFANPGFFQDKKISEFNFLQYSKKYWHFWAGNDIAFTNRLAYPYYIALSKKHHLEVVDFIGENYRPRVELDLNLIHNDVLLQYDFVPNKNELTQFQRGTLILKG